MIHERGIPWSNEHLIQLFIYISESLKFFSFIMA